jgi:hypothetical protein
VVSIFTAHTPTARKLERSGYEAHKVSRRVIPINLEVQADAER